MANQGLLEKLAQLGVFKAKKLLPAAGGALGAAIGGPVGGAAGQALGGVAETAVGAVQDRKPGQGALGGFAQGLGSQALDYGVKQAGPALGNLQTAMGGGLTGLAGSGLSNLGSLASRAISPLTGGGGGSATEDQDQGEQDPMAWLEELLGSLSDDQLQKLLRKRFSRYEETDRNPEDVGLEQSKGY